MNAAGRTCSGPSTGAQGNGAGDTIEQATWTNPGPGAVTVKLVVDVSATDGAVAPPFIDLRWRGEQPRSMRPRAPVSLNPDSNYTFGATSAAQPMRASRPIQRRFGSRAPAGAVRSN